MAKNAIVCVALALAVGGCAAMSRAARTAEFPSAAVAGASSVAGRWQGSINETAGSLVTGSMPIDVTIEPDGTWQGTVGKSPAAGHARVRGNRVVLQGTAAPPDGSAHPVYLDLKNNGRELWGQTVATFNGRDGRASVALERAQSG